MATKFYKASAPGSIMLFGEHAVLYKKHAIAAAINKKIHVKLIPREDKSINIYSKNYSNYSTSLGKFKLNPDFKFVLTAIHKNLKKIPSGFDLYIESDFPSTQGLGSSAAVTVATLKVLNAWCDAHQFTRLQLCKAARSVIQKVQDSGSGTDVAASVFGGVIAYQMSPIKATKIAGSLPLVLVYSGSKKPTTEVIKIVTAKRKQNPKLFSQIFNAMDICTKQAMIAIKKHDFSQLGNLMNIHNSLQDALGVNNEILSELIFALRQQPKIYGVKISGSGLGDCVVALGDLPAKKFPLNTKQKKMGVLQLEIKP